jgi:predicted Zn-dependent peptidase
MLLACEDSGARMSRIGAGLLLHGEVKPVDEILARIEAVDLDDVHRVARLLVEEPHALAVVGPFDPDTFDGAALGLAGHVA